MSLTQPGARSPISNAKAPLKPVTRSNSAAGSPRGGPVRIGAAPGTTSTAAASARRVILGLDFGTSTTKLVAQIEADDPSASRFLVLEPPCANGSVLCPSTVALHRGELLFGRRAELAASRETIRSFKMLLPDLAGSSDGIEPERRTSGSCLGESDLTAAEVSTLYLAHVIAHAEAALARHLGGSSFRLLVNAAAPLNQMQADPRLKGLFEQTFYRALTLAPHARDPWPLANAREMLQQVAGTPVPAAGESPVVVFPETHAAMTAYLLDPTRSKGKYATVDVGAGTTDVAFFWFHRTEGLPEACYYGANSEFVGLDGVDAAVCRKLGPGQGSPRARREALSAGQLKACREHYEPVLNEIFECYRKAFGRAYASCPREGEWTEPRAQTKKPADDPGLRKAKYTMCAVGGGSRFGPTAERLSASPWHPYIEAVPTEVPHVPYDYAVIGGDGRSSQTSASGDEALLLLAFGLAHRAIDIPMWQDDSSFRPTVTFATQPDHETIYAR